MNDIVERLRDSNYLKFPSMALEAADEIETLRRQLAEFKAMSAYRGQQLAEKDAEIERLNKNLLWSMQCTAESDLRAVKLRGFLDSIVPYRAYNGDDWPSKIAQEALALPSDDAALREMIAKAGEVMRERCVAAMGADKGPLCGTKYATDAIRALPGVTMEDLQK